MQLADVVSVTISLQTAQVTGIAFGRGLIYGHSARFTAQTARTYQASSWQTAMVADGFLTSDLEYIMAGAYFSQVPSPADVMVAQLAANVAQVATVTPVYADNTTYTVTINGTTYTYATTTGGSATTIVTGLKAAIGALATVVLTGTTTLIITSAVAGQLMTVTVAVTVGTGTITVVATTANLGPQENLAALNAAGYSAWYCLLFGVSSAELDLDTKQAAIYLEAAATKRLCVSASNSVACYDPASVTDVMYLLKAAAYTRTTVIFDAGTSPGTKAAAWAGGMLPNAPGSANWAFKTLVGETPSTLTDAQTAAILAKNGNYYVSLNNVSFTYPGAVPSGSYLDVTVGLDWLANTIQTDMLTLLKNQLKVNFDDGGIAQASGVLGGTLKLGVQNNVLSSYTLVIPKASSFSSAQRQTRVLTGLNFTGQLAGALNKITVLGNVNF